MQQLRALVQRPNSTDDEILHAISEFDKADADLHANQVKFLNAVSPLLNPRQQARVRMFQQMADRRLLQMINSARNPEGSEVGQFAGRVECWRVNPLRAMWRAFETKITEFPTRARKWKRRIQPRKFLDPQFDAILREMDACRRRRQHSSVRIVCCNLAGVIWLVINPKNLTRTK